MRKIPFGFLLFFLMMSAIASADTLVDGHVRKDGTLVPPHYRSTPNGNPFDNWSTKGNINPYTGKKGTKDPYRIYRPR